jgi:hypothetical protein
MLGYGEAPRRAMSWRRRLLRELPGLAPGLVGAVLGAGLVAALSGGALAPGRMALTAALTGVIFWLVQRRLSGNA